LGKLRFFGYLQGHSFKLYISKIPAAGAGNAIATLAGDDGVQQCEAPVTAFARRRVITPQRSPGLEGAETHKRNVLSTTTMRQPPRQKHNGAIDRPNIDPHPRFTRDNHNKNQQRDS